MAIVPWIIVAVFAFAGGFVQTVSGFGGAIVMMLAFPYFFHISGIQAEKRYFRIASSEAR